MTGYYFEIGYCGGSGWPDDAWSELKKSAREVSDNPNAIVAEARRLGSPETCEDGCCPLDDYANNYAAPFGTCGHPVTIHESKGDGSDGDTPYVAQHASTSGPIKYHVRRAFARLLIESMHRKEIEVNLRVS